ncbi:hypothetical protein GNIT_3720 [Glaciecola nitratireducens FR1064]|uniref:Uncharacterized protein n=1 Tax=Glaciecola nitratireducens (strain JCM 12485 / KCTC 12276 / FR1064) TaxID=1085623 RepID=G4QNL0_GLANF|nr:hypothetical protein GNIT_3720 [Glaciecola nitratireducens FR1064]
MNCLGRYAENLRIYHARMAYLQYKIHSKMWIKASNAQYLCTIQINSAFKADKR